MDSLNISHIEKKLAYKVIPALISNIGPDEAQGVLDPLALYDGALKRVVQWIIGSKNSPGKYSREFSREKEALYKEVEGLDIPIETLPALYERLRDYELKGAGQYAKIRKSKSNRRNQGLFYTPGNIVDYIVGRSFEALDESSPKALGAIKILDPSMGAGLFLQAAMYRIARCYHRSNTLGDFSPHGINYPDILERNLYGVDLDQVAGLIAKALLASRAGVFTSAAEKERGARNLKTGNSLIGAVRANGKDREFHDKRHAEAYMNRPLSEDQLKAWKNEVCPIHWQLEFPDVFNRPNPGFDMIIGNPPYETLSVKESGIRGRKLEQNYFRLMYKTCHGKINLYRLMLERGLELLREGGVLGFIVPVTLLADTTAKKLRKLIFDITSVKDAVIIPENARVFHGVTQACVILIVKKGLETKELRTSHWLGVKENPPAKGVSIPISVIESCGHRVPFLETIEEKELFLAVNRFPPLGGDHDHPPLAQARQGEINMTVQRAWITAEPSAYPLIRGEHVGRFRINHPTENSARLDWVKDEYVEKLLKNEEKKQNSNKGDVDSAVWSKERIAVARVVNIGSKIRLKAAKIKPYQFQGDMTNCLFQLNMDMDILIGLLNSSLLNWRFKKTSANNYISMAEIMALPAPRVGLADRFDYREQAQSIVETFMKDEGLRSGDIVGSFPGALLGTNDLGLFLGIIRRVSIMSQMVSQFRQMDKLQMILDGMVALLYGVDQIRGPFPQ